MVDSLAGTGSRAAHPAEVGTPVQPSRKKPDWMGSDRRSPKLTQVGMSSRDQRCSGWAPLRRERLEKLETSNTRTGSWGRKAGRRRNRKKCRHLQDWSHSQWRRSQASQAQPPETKKWPYVYWPLRTSSLKEGEMWHLLTAGRADPGRTAVAR
jgi:hypothetical protein